MVDNCPGGTLYTIRPGDSLSSLARRFGTTVAAITDANPGIVPTNLQIGQIICIPVRAREPRCPGGFFYTVVIGDTLYSIARRNNIPVPALIAANPGINPQALRIGQQICVPAPPPEEQPCPGRLYTIQPGDTFIGIARRFGYTLDALLAINPGVAPQNLRVGQQICLPPSPGAGPFPCFGGSIYRIRPGDTLYSIARRFGVTLDALLAANPEISPENLQVGDPICIPR